MGSPEIRASDAERDAALGVLREAVAEGRLTLEELGERTGAALAARTRPELELVTADLPAVPAAPPGRGTRWLVGLLGGDDRAGRWRIAPRCTVVNVMGGCDLDLREAIVEAPETVITVWSLMGGSDVIVPEGVAVEMGGFALLGGNDLKVGGPPPPEGAPVVRVRAFSLLGGTDVRSRPARSP